MPIVLYRVDERLIHGQVVIGWGHQLRPTRYIVVDDELSDSEWEQDLYRLGAGEVDVLFASTEEARSSLEEWRTSEVRSILLTRDTSTMRRLADLDLGLRREGLEIVESHDVRALAAAAARVVGLGHVDLARVGREDRDREPPAAVHDAQQTIVVQIDDGRALEQRVGGRRPVGTRRQGMRSTRPMFSAGTSAQQTWEPEGVEEARGAEEPEWRAGAGRTERRIAS